MLLRKICKCGCGRLANFRKTFVHGHNNTGVVFSEDRKRNISRAKKGWNPSEATRKRMSEWQLGRVLPKATRQKMSNTHKQRPGRFTKGNSGRKFTDEHRRKISEAAKRLRENPEYRDRIVRVTLAACRKTPNKMEQKLGRFLDSRYPGDWKFVGDASFIIAGKNPDFINVNGRKLIIELFGDYWHKGENPADRAKVFEPYGFRTLVIWEHELKNLLAVGSRLREFINVV